MSSYLQSLRQAKDAPVVAKTEFATFVSGVPSDHVVFVLEGPDDKIAYSHWLRILKPSLKYESLVQKNKTAVLRLFDALQSDITGLAKRVFYFVDRDFDDLQGREKSPVIFMTDQYSIENYSVCPEVLSEVLKDDFHCNGFNEAREAVIHAFVKVYAEFLKSTADLNFRIFVARKLRIGIQDEAMPSRLNQFASVDLLTSALLEVDVVDLVPLAREPNETEIAALAAQFAELDPPSRYRGKFSLLFFIRWLALLRSDRQAAPSQLFQGYPMPEFNVRGDFSFDRLIRRVPPPPHLQEFFAQMA